MISSYSPIKPDISNSKNSPDFRNPWFYTLLSCFILLLLFGARPFTSPDLGFHLKEGQWILENHHIPYMDNLTYTVSNHPYLDIHWLYQVFTFLLFQIGGYSILSVMNISLILVVFFITFKRIQWTGAPLWMCVLLLGVAIVASENRFLLRPEIPSWLLMSLMLWVLETRDNHKRDYLFLLPFIQVIWVNSEGLFGIGCVLMAIFILSSFLTAGPIDKRLVKYSLLSMALCLANPNFIQGALYPLSNITMLGTSNHFKQSINELQSPWTLAVLNSIVPEWTLWAYKLFCISLFFLLLITFKKRKTNEFLIAVCFFYLSATAVRNISIFMIACVPITASCWKELKWGWLLKCQSIFPKPLTAWVLTFLILGLSARVATGAFYVSERRPYHFGLGLDAAVPTRGAQFLVNNHLDGKILNFMTDGGWLDWLTPQKTFIDGRLEVMGEDFFSEYTSTFRPGGLAPILTKYGMDIIFFSPDSSPPWLLQLKDMPDWRPVYLDEDTVIYLRKGYAPQLSSLDDSRILTDQGISLSMIQQGPELLRMPTRPFWDGFLEGFYKQTRYPSGLNNIADYYSYTGRFDLAEALYLGNIQHTQGKYYEFFFNLGAMYFRANRFNEARICMQRVLLEVPDFYNAKMIMENLPPG